MAQLSKFGVPGGDNVLLMPKLANRFRVLFLGFAGNSLIDLGTLTSQIVSCDRPTLTTDSSTIEVYNSRIKLAGKTSWEDISLVVRDDISNSVAAVIATQLGRQMDHGAQSSATAGANYKFGMVIQTLDGGYDNVQVLDTWSIAGCFLKTVNYSQLSYAEAKAVEISFTVTFDNADYHIGEMSDSDLPGLLSDIGGGPALRAMSAGDSATTPL